MGRFTNSNSTVARWRRRRASRYVSAQSPVILGGCPRSGTTLLRVMLDSHPHLACGPETSLLTGSVLPAKLTAKFDIPALRIRQLRQTAQDHAHFIELFFNCYLELRGKQRWADKTPQNVRYLDYIFRHFPHAKFIHVIRDGRNVICSMRTHPKYRIVNGQPVPTGIRRPLKGCIAGWLRETGAGMKWRGHPHYLEVRYEDLVQSPEPTLRHVCEFIGEPWDAAMLDYHVQEGPSRDAARFITNVAATQPLSADALHRWRTDLTAVELGLVRRRMSDRLAALGYAVGETDRAAELSPPLHSTPRGSL